MQLPAGTRLGPYTIDRLLGAGGMGEVYQARDTRLDRTVALKVLPPDLAADAAHTARFHREARLISSLSHAHICALHDVGAEGAVHYLVLELLEGETLAARLARGPLPFSQAARLGAQIADALAAAHRHGLVHRDLKPGNIMLTPAGAKLLDFGLAKPVTVPVVPGPLQATIVGDAPPTAEGMIVGTLQYMAPEQVHGRATDARTDLFALGAVLYEMVTGQRAFQATTPAGLIAQILNADPAPIAQVVPTTPAPLAALIHRCLAKEPEDRWQSAHDVKLQLEWLHLHATTSGERPVEPAAPTRRWAVPVASALVGALLAAAPLLLRRAPDAGPPPVARRFDILLPEDLSLRSSGSFDIPEISPDGRWVAFGALVGSARHLMLLDLESQNIKPLVSNEDVSWPFWSPDSKAVGFFGKGSLKRASRTGGPPQVLASAAYGLGGTWRDGLITYAALHAGATSVQESLVHEVPEAGGPSRLVLTSPKTEGVGYVLPRALPNGTSMLLGTWPVQSFTIVRRNGTELRELSDGPGSLARLSGRELVYLLDGQLIARGFDPGTGQFTSGPTAVADGAQSHSVATDGTVVFRASGSRRKQLTWFSRAGGRMSTVGSGDDYGGLALAPDARRAAVWKTVDGNQDLWEIDLATDVSSRLTNDPATESDVTWSPDGTRVAFTSARSGTLAVYVKDRASGSEDLIAAEPGRPLVVDGWTPDGLSVVVRIPGDFGFRVAPLAGAPSTPRSIWKSMFVVDESQVAPDGRWIAYNSNATGTWEVYIARFPSLTSQRRLSTNGGVQPHWRADGRELFYLAPDGSMMSVRLDDAEDLGSERPVRLFGTSIEPSPNFNQYGVTPDGQRFLGLDRGPAHRERFTVLLNWLTPQRLGRK